MKVLFRVGENSRTDGRYQKHQALYRQRELKGGGEFPEQRMDGERKEGPEGAYIQDCNGGDSVSYVTS